MDTKKQILGAFNFRHACREFDPEKKISEEDFKVILETGRLSPSSFGFEPWKFVVLQNPEIREKIRKVAWGAQKQLPTASHFVVILARKAKDLRPNSEYLRNFMAEVQHNDSEKIGKRMARLDEWQKNDFNLDTDRSVFDWACKQSYIALGNMLTSAAFLGIDSCPIEGFNRDQLEDILTEEKILNPDHFGVACMAAFGYRVNEQPEKIRRPMEEVAKWVK